MPVSAESLQAFPIFRGMSHEERAEILDASERCTFDPGKVILRQGKVSRNIWILLEGSCEVVKEIVPGTEMVFTTLGEGTIFGELSFFHPAPHTASVRAVGRVQALRLRRERYDDLAVAGRISAYKLAANAAAVLAQRFRRMDNRIAELIQQRGDDGEVAEWRQFRARLYGDWNI